MRGLMDTTARRRHVYGNTNTNTLTLTIDAEANEAWVIDQVIWSLDTSPSAGNSHVTITDTTANTIVCKWDLTTSGPAQLTFSGLQVNTNASINVTLLASTPGADSHLAVLYH